MITEDYVSFETAKLLKEKGFDEATYRAYIETNKEHQLSFDVGRNNSQWEKINKENSIFNCSAPTLQMTMKWLREVHKIHVSVEMGFDVDNRQYFFFAPSICKFSNKTGEYQTPFGEKEFDSYEDACEAAIKYCLENLI